MKTNQFLLKGILLLILFGMILVQLSAQDKNQGKAIKQNPKQQTNTPATSPVSPPSPPSPNTPPPPPPVPDAEQEGPPPALDLPDLTNEQKEKIKKIDLQQMGAMTPLRNQMREKRVRLTTILTTMPVDMKAADQIADEIGKIVTSILKVQIRHDQELRGLLTPDQQIIFDARPKPFMKRRPGL
jgi:Spy/CpxP family protein refolding chaperone